MQLRKFDLADKRVVTIISLLVLAVELMALFQDRLGSHFRQGAFYFSESFMFSSFWWIFAPLLIVQYWLVKKVPGNRPLFVFLLMVLPALLHLFGYPLLVWALSKLFYYHTYAYRQTLQYTLSEYIYILALFYSLPLLFYRAVTKKALQADLPDFTPGQLSNPAPPQLLVTDGNKKLAVPVAAIYCFTANPPYINIHLADKKFLQHTTLKSMAAQLNPEEFIRVHKSAIVNINRVASYKTRLNGDYDLLLQNGTEIRLSRNFAAGFKALYAKTHQLTTK